MKTKFFCKDCETGLTLDRAYEDAETTDIVGEFECPGCFQRWEIRFLEQWTRIEEEGE